jgi:hypothetical protein
MKKIIAILCLIIFISGNVFAAVGCDLNDPDRDVKRLFPHSTSYRTDYKSIKSIGGDSLLKEIEKRLGDEFQGLFETIDVPYTIYTIYKEKDIIGYIHGINQKGIYGGLQVFLGYDKDLNIINFYYQKLTSKKAKEMRKPEFAKQFEGLNLNDFKNYNPKNGIGGSEKLETIKNLSDYKGDDDFKYTLRAIKKNLILTDIFIKH